MSQPSATVALIGNPNTGKSSLFNALCGGNARVGNYPGVTVEQKTGRMTLSAATVEIVDLPGTYSLAARSADEAVAVDVLSGAMQGIDRPDAVIVIADATNLERNLYLFSQVIELGLPTLLVLNMWDRIASTGMKIDPACISEQFGVPVVCTSASQRKGIDEVRQALASILTSKIDRTKESAAFASTDSASSNFPEAFRMETQGLLDWLRSKNVTIAQYQVQRLLIDASDAHVHREIPSHLASEVSQQLSEARSRLASAGVKIPLFETQARYAWIKQKTAGLIERPRGRPPTISDAVDR
jgi:ferrous iron transport protein B